MDDFGTHNSKMGCHMSNNLLIWKGYKRDILSSYLVQGNKRKLQGVICNGPLILLHLMGSVIGSKSYRKPQVFQIILIVSDYLFCQMYQEFMTALDEAGKNDACVVAMVTGTGDYYCSGNDLSNFTRIPPEGPQKMASDARQILK